MLPHLLSTQFLVAHLLTVSTLDHFFVSIDHHLKWAEVGCQKIASIDQIAPVLRWQVFAPYPFLAARHNVAHLIAKIYGLVFLFCHSY